MPDPKLDLGLMVEGVIELDPMSGRLVIRYEDKSGVFQFHDIQEQLLRYKGEEVRCIITPMASVAKLAHMVEQGSVKMDEIPKVPKLS